MGADKMPSDGPDAATVREAFLFFDKEGKDYLTQEEFVKMVQSLGQTPTQDELKDLLEKNDCTEGEIKLDAITAMMPEITKTKKTRSEVIDAFKVFDNNSDGCITVDSFKQMMGQVGEKLGPKEIDEAVTKALEIAKGSSDGQDAIEYARYVDWMMST